MSTVLEHQWLLERIAEYLRTHADHCHERSLLQYCIQRTTLSGPGFEGAFNEAVEEAAGLGLLHRVGPPGDCVIWLGFGQSSISSS